MTEAIGHASTAEIPIVVADCQRVGPSTGQPTRTEQSDLSHLANLGHGEYPRFILAPADPVDAFELTVQALNLAERWRLPVILLLDQALCQNTTTSPRFDLSRVHLDRGKRLTPEAAEKLAQYKVYEVTDDGVSAVAPPGTPGLWSEVTGNEHDEWGHVSVNVANRVRMMKKRMEKMVKARNDLPACRVFGPADARIGFIGFGSTSGPIFEALRLLEAKGVRARYLQARTLYPVPVHEIDPFLKGLDTAYVVEQNFTGQLARLLRETMPWHHAKLRSVLKYDGYSFRAPQILAAVQGDA
jgi:2-oxoglutarate ferredoxin oxidoreductase subunit alpha